MENIGELVGCLAVVVLLACPALYFLINALRSGPHPRRLADLGLFCGLTALVLPEIAIGLSPANWPRLFLASGAVRLIFGLAAIALAVVALALRRGGGGGVWRPLAAAASGILQIMCGAGLLLFASFDLPSTPWVYQSQDEVYSLTLPSRQWKKVSVEGDAAGVAFACRSPRTQAKVLRVKTQQSEVDFARAVDAWRSYVDSHHDHYEGARFRDGTNAAGNRYQYSTLMDTTHAGQPVFVAYAVTWCPHERAIVEVLVEGLPRMLSETGKAAELIAFEKAAEIIGASVGCQERAQSSASSPR